MVGVIGRGEEKWVAGDGTARGKIGSVRGRMLAW